MKRSHPSSSTASSLSWVGSWVRQKLYDPPQRLKSCSSTAEQFKLSYQEQRQDCSTDSSFSSILAHYSILYCFCISCIFYFAHLLVVKMSTALEVTGFFMCLVGWMVTGLAVANDYWKISSVQGTVIISNRLYENLWHACGEDSSGKANCQDFQSMLALPGRK